MKSQTSLKNAIVVATMTTITKILGFFKSILLSFFYGTSNISDVFNIQITISDTVFSFLGNGINTSFIPLYREAKNDSSKKGDEFTSQFLSFSMIITLVLACFSCVFAKFLVKIIAPGFSQQSTDLSIKLTQISIWGIFFTAIVYVFVALLQSWGLFLWSSMATVIQNIFFCFSIALSYYFNILWLAYGVLLGVFCEAFILSAIAYKHGFRFKLRLDFLHNRLIKEAILISLPVMLSVSANRINIVVDKAIASTLNEGSIASLNYAVILIDFVKVIISTSIITSFFPELAKNASKSDYKKQEKIVSKAIGVISLLILPIGVGVFILAEPIVRIVYFRGAFSLESLNVTTGCLKAYSIGLIGFSLRDLLIKVYYANKKTIVPVINSVIGITINIFLNFILSRSFGLKGLAYATSFSSLFILILLYLSLGKKVNIHISKDVFLDQLKMLISSVIMGFVVFFFNICLKGRVSLGLELVLDIVSGALVYFICLLILKEKEVIVLINEFINKRKKGDNDGYKR